MISLETDRLILRDCKEGDLDAYFRLKSDDTPVYYLQAIKSNSYDEAGEEFKDISLIVTG